MCRKFLSMVVLVGFTLSTALPQPTFANQEENILKKNYISLQSISVSEAEVISEAVVQTVEDSTGFLMDDFPLSAAEPEAIGEEDIVIVPIYNPQDSRENPYTTPEIEIPNDPYYSTYGSWGQNYDDLWWIKQLSTLEAWQFTRGADAVIAVIDSGIDRYHRDISPNLWYNDAELNGLPGVDDDGNGFIDDFNGWDFVYDDNYPNDYNGHGSHVSGIAAAAGDNGTGIIGIAPESKILPVRVLDASGYGSWDLLAEGIRYAADMGAAVINMSLGGFISVGSTFYQMVQSAIEYAYQKGVIIVAAAGNENADVSTSYPAAFDHVISVGALDHSFTRASFSNYGPGLDISAPGVDVLSLRSGYTYFGNSFPLSSAYARASGTSMATPVISGVAALMKSMDASLTYDDVIRRLNFSAIDLGGPGRDNLYGYGLVDPFAALSFDYYEDGSMKTHWLPYADPEGIIRYDYDGVGRTVRTEFEDHGYAEITYDESTGLKKQTVYYDSEGAWQRTVVYDTDGTTILGVSDVSGIIFEFDTEGGIESETHTTPQSAQDFYPFVFYTRPGERTVSSGFNQMTGSALESEKINMQSSQIHEQNEPAVKDQSAFAVHPMPFFVSPEWQSLEKENAISCAWLELNHPLPGISCHEDEAGGLGNTVSV